MTPASLYPCRRQVRALVAGHAEALLALSSHMSARAMAVTARTWMNVSCESSAGLVLLTYITAGLASLGFLAARAPQLVQLAASIAKRAAWQQRKGCVMQVRRQWKLACQQSQLPCTHRALASFCCAFGCSCVAACFY